MPAIVPGTHIVSHDARKQCMSAKCRNKVLCVVWCELALYPQSSMDNELGTFKKCTLGWFFDLSDCHCMCCLMAGVREHPRWPSSPQRKNRDRRRWFRKLKEISDGSDEWKHAYLPVLPGNSAQLLALTSSKVTNEALKKEYFAERLNIQSWKFEKNIPAHTDTERTLYGLIPFLAHFLSFSTALSSSWTTCRQHPQGLQGKYSLNPDLTTLGKYISGGLAFGAFGGCTSLLAAYDPRVTHNLPHYGTFNNNSVAISCGYTGFSQIYPDLHCRSYWEPKGTGRLFSV